MSGYPATLDLSFTAGESFEREMTWAIGGVPVNLTGFTATATIRVNVDDASAVRTLTVGSGITLGGAAGTILLTIADDVTAAMTARVYVWDLFLVSGGGLTTPLTAGRVFVRKPVTR